jgi:transcriptional regulator with XRE-family HTH domain
MLIGDRIKELRKSLNMTQTDFAEKLRSAQNTITGYENGRRSPSNQMIDLMCREFNVNEEWLRTGNGEMFLSLDRDDELAIWAGSLLKESGIDNQFMKQFVHMLSKLNTEDWSVIEKMARLLSEEKKNEPYQ